ncbi:MAG: radical SAM protein [Bacteroidetes bacterium]|nr:MAG: radical SAM protein [Bacteroidota bacterium]
MAGRFRDKLNLLSKFTFRRYFNAAKVLGAYYVSRWTGKSRQWGMPVSVSVEPTTSCNLRCPECPSGLREFTRPTGMLDPEFFRKTIDELSPSLLYLTLYFQGEPYLNRNFLEMAGYASGKGIYVSTSTNAHFLDDDTARRTVESGLDRLTISIDGSTQETYAMYRVGGSLGRVINGTKNIVKWKKKLRSRTPYLIFQFLVVKPNEHQVSEVYRMAEELGVDEVRLKTAQVYDYEHGNPLIPENDKYSRYEKLSDGTYRVKNSLANHCWRLWHSAVITWDGLVVPCCFDKDAKHKLGNLQQESFRELWFNGKYAGFRASVLRSRSSIDICSNCTEGTKVWVSKEADDYPRPDVKRKTLS